MTDSPPAATEASSPDGSPLDLAELVSRSARRLRRGSVVHLAPLGLTMAQARVLRMLADGPLRMAEIAARLEVVPRTVTPMVDGLEAAGLVRRRTDIADRRSVLVETTDGGRLLLERLHEVRRATAEQVFGALNSRERARLTELLGRLCADGCCPEGGRR